jgi:fatty-acyl-CoA synthase
MSSFTDSIPAALRASVFRFPEKPFLIAADRIWTYRQVHDETLAIADCLEEMGLRAGDRVAILDVDSIEYVVLLLALAAIGAIAVPLNYRQQLPELSYQIENSGARLLLANQRYMERVSGLSDKLEFGPVAIDRFFAEAAKRGPSRRVLNDLPGNTPFVICYTSGTTGKPKGAVLEQRTLWLRAMKFIVELGIVPDDIVHATFPMFHIGGLVFSLMALLRGASFVVYPQFELGATMALVRERRVTFMTVVPTMFAMMAKAEGFDATYFGDLRLILYAGAPMNPQLLKKIMGVYRGDLVQSFGQTEDLPQSILTPEDHRWSFRHDAARLASIGKPPIGVELRLVDNDGMPVPVGEIGEIVTRGGTGMTEYWGLPEETAKTLKQGWVHSGDLGYHDKDGYLYLAGRKRQMIIRGGENVYPAEVEKVLHTLPYVSDCVVVGLPDEKWGEIVAAVLVCSDPSVAEADIIAHCRQFLASYRCPEKVFFKQALPYNATGKVDRSLVLADIAATAS